MEISCPKNMCKANILQEYLEYTKTSQLLEREGRNPKIHGCSEAFWTFKD